MKHLQKNPNLPIFFGNDRIIAVSTGSFLSVITELQIALTICNLDWIYPDIYTLKATLQKLQIKIKILESDLTKIIDIIAKSMFEEKNLKQFPNLSKEEQLDQLRHHVWEELDQLEKIKQKTWKISIQFIWKTGSSKKFIEESKNLIRFLNQ